MSNFPFRDPLGTREIVRSPVTTRSVRGFELEPEFAELGPTGAVEEEVSYEPAELGDWQVTPTLVSKALDELASRSSGSASQAATFVVAAAGASAKVLAAADFVCDGIDDDVQIQAALDALSAGGMVVLSEGAFAISGTVKVGSNTTLWLNPASVLTLASEINAAVIENSDFTNGNENIRIIGGEIDGNKANQSSGDSYGIYFQRVTRGHIEGVHVHDTFKAGIEIAGLADGTRSTDSHIVHNRVIDCGTSDAEHHSGIIVFGFCDRISIMDNIVSGSAQVNIRVWSGVADPSTNRSKHHRIIGNFAGFATGTATGIGIAVAGARNGVISGNVVAGNPRNGIDLNACQEFSVADNACVSNNGSGGTAQINPDNCFGLTITGNTCESGGQGGIVLHRSRRCTVIGNHCVNNGGNGSGTFRMGIGISDDGATIAQQNILLGNRCWDAQGTRTQTYGLDELNAANGGPTGSAPNNNSIIGNDFRTNLTGALRTTGANTIRNANRGDAAADRETQLESYLRLPEITAPGTPPANTGYLFAKDVGGVSHLVWKDDAGVEHDLTP